MHLAHRPRTLEDIDKFISAEIPNKELQPNLFIVVEKYMVHDICGPYNKKCPCMNKGRCTKNFPKKIRNRTILDEEGFPRHRRRDHGRTIVKKGVDLDNSFIVPYNPTLLLRYECQINVEYTCQSSSIKYLFKYVHKRNDRVTATLFNDNVIDEIKIYYDCRYISSCGETWRFFGFNIQYKQPLVIRLSFHLPGEQSVIYEDNESIENVVNKTNLKIFVAWMKTNKIHPDAQSLSYDQKLFRGAVGKKYLMTFCIGKDVLCNVMETRKRKICLADIEQILPKKC